MENEHQNQKNQKAKKLNQKEDLINITQEQKHKNQTHHQVDLFYFFLLVW